MIIISPEQNTALSDTLMADFIKRGLSFLRDNASAWSQNKEDDELFEFIDAMITFAKQQFVSNENNILQLMLYKIEFDFTEPLSDYHQMLLGRQDFGESYRVKQFYSSLMANNELIKITLDSDLDQLR
jgi:hypothetical protein